MKEIERGDVVQIAPRVDMWGSCFMVVTDLRPWGFVGYVPIPRQGSAAGTAYVRMKRNQVHWIGAAEWMDASALDSGADQAARGEPK